MHKQVINVLFGFCWLLIGLTSAYDLYLLVHFRAVIQEQNPIGNWLIELDGGDVSAFAALKMAGTILSLGTLFVSFQWCRKIGITAAIVLAILQSILIAYQMVF